MVRKVSKAKGTASSGGAGIRTTRAKKNNAPVAVVKEAAHCPTQSGDEQHALLILPRGVSSDGRIISLVNPATSLPARYFFCPILGLHEFTRVGPTTKDYQSCLIASDTALQTLTGSSNPTLQVNTTVEPSLGRGYVLKSGDVLVATRLDPIFFLAPLFSDVEDYYRPADDYMDQLVELQPSLSSLMGCSAFKEMLTSRLALASAIQDIGGGELVYRPQMSLLLNLIRSKCISLAKQGLPASMEEALVQKVLDVPLVPQQILAIEQSRFLGVPEVTEEQTRVGADEHCLSSAVPPSTSVPIEVLELMRQRVAMDFILASYVPWKLRTCLEALMQSTFKEDFMPLEDYLVKVKQAKAEAQTLRSLSDNISRKRSALDDDEAAELRAEKKQKKEEDEKRKKAETRATKELKKVDTTGMKKLSSFFTRSATAAKA